jgi:hypothetical protein
VLKEHNRTYVSCLCGSVAQSGNSAYKFNFYNPSVNCSFGLIRKSSLLIALQSILLHNPYMDEDPPFIPPTLSRALTFEPMAAEFGITPSMGK